MHSKATKLIDQQSSSKELEKTSSKINLSDVFAERKGSYLNEFTLFIAHFNAIPHFINEIKIDCKRAIKWFYDTYLADIWDLHYFKRYFSGSKKAELDDIFYILYDDLIVDFDTTSSTVRFLFRKTDISKVDSVINGIKKFRERKLKRKPEISLLVNTSLGIGTTSLQITRPKLNIADNYNDDFKVIHETIMRRLSKKNDKGLIVSSNLEIAVEKGLDIVQNTSEIWCSSDYAKKQTLQYLIFPKGILYNKPNDTLRTHKINYLFQSIAYLSELSAENKKDNLSQDCLFGSNVGMTRFELATPRPPDVCATGLRYIPKYFIGSQKCVPLQAGPHPEIQP